MADDEPLVRLPDEVVLSRDEVTAVLFALDVVEPVALSSADAARVEDAAQAADLQHKLWPELGDLLGDGDG